MAAAWKTRGGWCAAGGREVDRQRYWPGSLEGTPSGGDEVLGADTGLDRADDDDPVDGRRQREWSTVPGSEVFLRQMVTSIDKELSSPIGAREWMNALPLGADYLTAYESMAAVVLGP